MKNAPLANWLEHCHEYISQTQDPTSLAVFEGILHAVSSGNVEMLESIVGGAARNAVAMGENLDEVNQSIQITKLVIWGRIEQEVEPEAAWDMMISLELVFQIASRHAVQNYIDALTETHQRLSAEAARLSKEAEQKVMTYATELARTNRELARLEKAKTDFISIAAHELKTPLTIVQGYIDMLTEKHQANQSEEDAFILKGITTGTERLSGIVNDLLDVSAIETDSLVLHREDVSVDNLVNLLAKRSQPIAQSRQQSLQTEIAPNLPMIYSDPKRLYQVIEQIINNAIKYTPDGGVISLRTYHETLSQNEAGFIKIEVTDNGIGISPEDKDHIFNKFYRVGETQLHSTGKTKFKGAGPGLGLSIAKGIIDVLNGQIWVESPGHDEVNCPGSTFHIRLPVNI